MYLHSEFILLGDENATYLCSKIISTLLLGTFSKIFRNLQLVEVLKYKYVQLLLESYPIVDIPTRQWPSDQM